MNPICPECGKESQQATGERIYPHRQDLWHLKFYLCEDCNAYVGCHRTTGEPLGSLATEDIRAARREAHAVFDPVWKQGVMQRHKAYSWLAKKLGIKVKDCHIGQFDVETCKRVVNIVHGTHSEIAFALEKAGLKEKT